MRMAEEILDTVQTLDPLPATAQMLTQLVAEDRASVIEIAAVLEHDEAVAANLLRISNCALYAGLHPIETVREAVVRLGITTLLNVVLHGYLRRLGRDAPPYDLSENDLWLHGAVASMAASEIRRDATDAEIPVTVGIAGLVHDIGKLLMVRFMKVGVADLLRDCATRGVSFIQAERDLVGCDHAQVGGLMARRWKFPEEVARAIERHHDVPAAADDPLLDTVVLANLTCKTLGVGLGAEAMNFDLDLSPASRLGIDYVAFCRICARTAARLQALRETYQIAVPGPA